MPSSEVAVEPFRRLNLTSQEDPATPYKEKSPGMISSTPPFLQKAEVRGFHLLLENQNAGSVDYEKRPCAH